MTTVAARILRGTVEVDRSRLDAVNGVRTALGVALPLLVGLLVDRPLDGAAAAGGAFFAGFAAFAVGYRRRVRSVLLASAAIGLSTFAGAAVGQDARLLVPTVVVWGFAAGLSVCLGVAPGIIGTQAVIGLLVITQYAMPLEDAAGRALLALGGGLLQALLVVAAWPLRRAPVERRAVAAVYASLGAYARVLADGHASPPDSGPLAAARTALADPQPLGRGTAGYRSLLEEGERLRTTLAALGHARASLAGVAVRAEAVRALDALAADAAEVLALVSAALLRPGDTGAALVDAGAGERWARLQAAGGVLGAAAGAAGPATAHLGPSLLLEVDRRAQDLLASLRAAVTPVGAGERGPVRGRVTTDVRATLRANLTLRSAAYRHALRLAAVLGLGTAFATLLPFEHRYWLPLTALVVLRPDFTSTFTRGVSRIIGTALGAAVASALAAVLQPGPALLATLIVGTAFACYTVVFANYTLYGLSVTGFVVFLLGFTGLPGAATVLDRIEATVLGGLLALVAYAAWPTWERVRVAEQLARLLQAQARYAGALLRQYAAGAPDLAAVQDLRAAARLVRTGAEASVAAALSEPGSGRVEAAAALGVATRRYAVAALALQAHLPQVRASRAPGELEQLAVELDAAAGELAAALREGREPGALPALRTTQERLRARLAGEPGDLDAAVLDVEVDQLVGSVLAVQQGLRAGARKGL